MTTLTLAIIKPHILKNPCSYNCIHQCIIDNGFNIVRRKMLHFNDDLASSFYAEHNGKFFYRRLTEFMCSGTSEVMILERHDAIQKWREMLGPTKVYRAIISHPDSIRGLYGLSDTRNACHGSDNLESAEKEIKFFFPDFMETDKIKII